MEDRRPLQGHRPGRVDALNVQPHLRAALIPSETSGFTREKPAQSLANFPAERGRLWHSCRSVAA